MTIEAQIAQLQQAAAEQTDASLKLASDVTDSINEIDQVKVDINQTHELIKSNHQAINDWQTKTGKVTLKDFNGQSYQVDTLPSLIGEAQKINPHPEVMSKAQFDALRKLRKQQFAGSGFVEWGQHWASAGAHRVVNQGMWEQTNGVLHMGINSSSTGQGESTTKYPIAVVDGVELRLDYVARNTNWCDIRFPPAPDGTKTYDSATGQVTQHASAAEAFGGVIKQAAFSVAYDLPVTAQENKPWHMLSSPSRGTASIANGKLTVIDDGTGGEDKVNYAKQDFVLEPNTTYRATYYLAQYQRSGGVSGINFIQNSTGSEKINFVEHATGDSGRFDVEFTTGSEGGNYYIVLYAGDNGFASYSHVSVSKVTEQVITSRKDLVFLESWHEKISDKDVVYPLGNVQFGASTYQDVPLLNNLVAQGYSAFGQWDQNTKGFGVKWSTLSAANRLKFLKNPEHNIYYDPETKAYCQVRYRIRVVEGLGDQWSSCQAQNKPGNLFGYEASAGEHVVARGAKSDTFSEYRNESNMNTSFRTNDPIYGLDSVGAGETFWRERGIALGKCFAVPIALVQRLNQGAYHPTYNPMGTGKRRISGGYYYHWFETHNALTEISSTFDCFDVTANNGGGNIGPNCGWANIATGSSHSGRVDQYVFYDAIYAGQVEDLRLNANKLDINQLREEALSKAVAGTFRGKESVPFTYFEHKYGVTLAARASYNAANAGGSIEFAIDAGSSPINEYLSDKTNIGYYVYNQSGAALYIPHLPNPKISYVHWPYSGGSQTTCYIYSTENKVSQFNALFSVGDVLHIGVLRRKPAQFDSLPWVDIVGHPERIAATFPDGVVGKWLPKLPDDSYGYPLNRKMVGSTLNATYTRDLGASWTNSNVGFDSVKNTSSGSWNPDIVALLSYQVFANNTQAQSLKPVIGDVGNVYATQAHRIDYGNRLQHSLNNTVGTRADSPHFQEELVVTKIGKHYPSSKLTWTNRAGDEPRHVPLSLDSQEEPSSAIKTLSTLVEKDGLLYLQFNGVELKYHKQQVVDMSESSTEPKTEYGVYRVIDGPLKGKLLKRIHSTATAVPFNDADWSIDEVGFKYQTNTEYSFKFFTDSFDWGDDQTIPIIDGENIKTDLNGNTVKVFCHHTQLPLGIASH
ncbi:MULTISPECIES: hypothetical protein [Pseudoalteromonas]|uniref:Uncharacterized protein n=1 Tax=Pseudoalteromonas amylolytica TaxID=1859457 RepID=A0A1S1MWL0_9GAMM|nr:MULTISPECIES: hypothetical protein [Pseudoalteromonas]OHU87828.1 hypothetical protein BFC16_10465 [Pseudoalteromonas sp. JW3]OHU91268.1 hypothetical protein BET10_10585 [Pseudoalteromonas amylolytica]